MFSRRLKGGGAFKCLTRTGFGVGICSRAPIAAACRFACVADDLRPGFLSEAFFMTCPFLLATFDQLSSPRTLSRPSLRLEFQSALRWTIDVTARRRLLCN